MGRSTPIFVNSFSFSFSFRWLISESCFGKVKSKTGIFYYLVSFLTLFMIRGGSKDRNMLVDVFGILHRSGEVGR